MTEPASKDGLPILAFPDPAAWEAWVANQPDDAPGLWLKIAKKDSGIPTVTYAEALDVALCHGWIDGQKGRFDDQYFVQRFTPRRPRSRWSKINVDKVAQLIAAGRMRPRGQKQVDAAQADGRWQAAYASSSTITVPEDLEQALLANPQAQAFFATLDRTNRFAILYRVQDAKRPETRARRIETFVAMLARGEKVHS